MFAPPSRTDPDAAIRSTDDDAAQSRLSAVRKGYLHDPFIHLLVPRSHLAHARPPLINIGTFLRSGAIDSLVDGWIHSWPEDVHVQIVSLGAGSDTRFWRMSDSPLKHRISKYVEVDFPEVTGRKAMTICKYQELRDTLGPDIFVEKGGTMLSSSVYNLVPADIRADTKALFDTLSTVLSSQQPTIVLAECVFPYMSQSASAYVLQWFPATFSNIGVIVYEMFGLEDSFGRVMRANLQSRAVELPGVEASIDSEQERFIKAGYTSTRALTLKEIRASQTPSSELERIAMLELLDEIEELELVLNHYTVACAWATRPTKRVSWTNWGTRSGS